MLELANGFIDAPAD